MAKMPSSEPSSEPSSQQCSRQNRELPGDPSNAPVVLLNEAATVYAALAQRIEGSAVGWSDPALAELEENLLARYGPVVGGRTPVRRLVRLASRSRAA